MLLWQPESQEQWRGPGGDDTNQAWAGLVEASVLHIAFCLPTSNTDSPSAEQGRLKPTRADGSGRLECRTRPGLSSPDLLDGGKREARPAIAGLPILPKDRGAELSSGLPVAAGVGGSARGLLS